MNTLAVTLWRRPAGLRPGVSRRPAGLRPFRLGLLRLSALLFLTAVSFYDATAAGSSPTGFPFTDESLSYSVNWPSRLSLGESHLRARHSGTSWDFELSLDAGVPGFSVKDLYRSISNGDFCSQSFDRLAAHGSRRTDEKDVIDAGRGVATRTTANGGAASAVPVPACVKDALTFLYYSRRELGQGRVPAAQQMLFGGLYQIRLDYAGAQTIPVNGIQTLSDKVTCSVQGPSSSTSFEMYFARDAARTPLLFKVPLAMGTFSMELTH
jgi:hypothetical protein